MANAKLGTKAVGSIVKLNVNGAAKEFIVVHQGKPSSLYDESCDGTWLLMKDIFEPTRWHSSDVNNLENSTIHSILNSTLLNAFESNIRDAIKQVKIPYRKNGGSSGSDQSGANGLLCKIFLLSGYEIGFTTSDNSYLPVDGAKLSYFEAGTGSSALNKRIAYWNGSADNWYLRSPVTYNTSLVWLVNYDGVCEASKASNSAGIRPALILPPDMEVDSSGNVTPPPPATHKALINGTAYEIKGGKCLVNGTVYNILKGRTLIGGTGYDITFPSAGTKLSALGVGQSVFTNVSGVKKEFLVVHQGLPSSLYDSSCDGTWLLMKDIYEMRQWNSNSELLYENSSIHSYLNSTFLSLFDANIQSAIKQAKIPYLKGGKGGSVQSGANGLSCKVFLLGGYELNFRNIFPADGAGLDGFAESIINNPAYLATYNGTLTKWWLRSITTLDINYAGLVRGYTYDSASVTESNGIRPCIILPSDALVNEEFELIA
jgi:hypothetical protein